MKYLLGIDLGTSETKTVLFDEVGTVIASATAEYPLYQPQNGWAEQDPEDWWNAAVLTIKSVIESSRISAKAIVSLGISGQMHGLVMLNENGNVLRRSIIWCDQRTENECREITEKVGAQRLIDITANPALTGFTASKILWVKNNEPEIFTKCRHILLPKDYLRYKLTGDFATDVSDASGMQLLNIKGRNWSHEILNILDIDSSLLGKVYESAEVTGKISNEASRLTGLATDTVVVGGAGDNAAAAVGTGVVSDGKAFTTIGTSGVVFAHTDKISIDRKGRVHTFCCAVPGAWHVMGVTQGAGLSLKWFRDNFCEREIMLSKKQGTSPYDLMSSEAENIGIGANRLIYLPYLMGERTPHLDANCRGVFLGLSAMHTKYNMIRAIMEGVAYSLKDCLSVLSEMGITPENMLACGGGGTSSLWRQILADVYNCPISTVLSKDSPALGAAILAGVGAGVFSSVQSACESIIRVKTTQYPNKENIKKYERVYNVYRKIYPALKEIYTELATL